MVEKRESIRLDKWLWAARFFRTRTLARDAIEGGKVYIDNLRAKPSRAVSIGDLIVITTQGGRYEIVVEEVSSRRGSATIASKLYRETEESKRRREELGEIRRLARNAAPEERPNSQDRKRIRRIKERFYSNLQKD